MKQTFIKWLKKLEDFYFFHIRKYLKNPKVEFFTYFLYTLAESIPYVPIQIQWILTLIISLP